LKKKIGLHYPEGLRAQIMLILLKLFFLNHFSRNTCNYFEYPIELSSTIYTKGLNGQNLSIRNFVLNEFQFDERLKGYSWMEDALFSNSINEKHPKTLLITPNARYTHTKLASGVETRPSGRNLVDIKKRNRKYVQIQLWGSRGLLIFGWQNLGILIFKALAKYLHRKIELIEEI
jgi:hypothetical protein